jgi:methionine salvage enolase-phosphatase E1
MMDINYNETVVLPYFQRKYQELLSANVSLEISYLMEKTKSEKLQETVNELTKKLEAQTKKKKKEESTNDETF